MKKILIVFLALSLLIGCTPSNKPDPQPGPVPVNPTPEPTPDPTPTPDPQPEPSGGEIKIPDDLTYADITLPYTFKFSKEIEGYAFNGIKLVFAGKQETPDFAANEKTIVYSRILINGKDTEVFSNMPLPVNDKVGTMTLTQLNDNYVLSFNTGAQINGQYVTCFNMDGEKIEDFSDVSITAADGLLTVEKDQQFAIDYIRTYLSKEDTLLLIKNKDYKQNLEQVRSDARDIGAFLTEFCIFSYLMGDYDSYWDEFEYSGIKYGFIFIDNLYPQYLVKEAEGGNFLCLVPTSTTATMEINSYATGKKENLFTTDCGQPVLLETQLMTGAATVEVVIKDNGKTYTFTPFYTEEDYKVDGDIVHVIDEDHLPQHYFHDYYQLIIDNTAESEDSDWAELNFNWVEDIGENMCLPARVYSTDENGKTIVKYYKVGVDLDCLFVFNPDTSEYDRYY